MGNMKKVLPVIVVVCAFWMYFRCCQDHPLPNIDPDPWWGSGDRLPEDDTINIIRVNAEQKDLDDLESRLSLPLRLSPTMENVNFSYGFHSSTLEKIVDYWLKEYSWKKVEKILNSFENYKTRIEGLNIHYMRSRPKNVPESVKTVPLLLVHGWPGSIVEFIDILPFLTKPNADSTVVFDVICPSVPGFGFSDASKKPGLGQLQTGQIFQKLMKRIGFEKYYVQGGDWGALVAQTMAKMYPENVLGMHVNMWGTFNPSASLKYLLGNYLPSGTLFSKEYDSLFYPMGKVFSILLRESGYFHIQATKPDTIGASLSNSPAGLAAYILEKFSTGTNMENVNKPDGGLLSKDFPISLDRLLDNVNLYWYTRTITSSMRYYSEFISTNAVVIDKPKSDVPAAFTLFRGDVVCDPEEFAALIYSDIVYHRLLDGGHFAAMEQPKLLAEQIHEFVTIVEGRKIVDKKSEL